MLARFSLYVLLDQGLRVGSLYPWEVLIVCADLLILDAEPRPVAYCHASVLEELAFGSALTGPCQSLRRIDSLLYLIVLSFLQGVDQL